MADARGEPYLQDWPLRPWLLAGFLALFGLAIHLLTQGHHDSAARVAAASVSAAVPAAQASLVMLIDV